MSASDITCKVCQETYDGFQFDYCPICDEMARRLNQELKAATAQSVLNNLKLEENNLTAALLFIGDGTITARMMAQRILSLINLKS